MSLPKGTVLLRRYEVLGPAGSGTRGEVYAARDLRAPRDVEVTLLPHALVSDPAALERLLKDARALAALGHPGIPVVHDFALELGVSCAIGEPLRGETLRARLARGPLAATEVARAARAVAEALAAAHGAGVVHGGVAAEKVFLTEDGGVKLLGFGLPRAEGSDSKGDVRALGTLLRASLSESRSPLAEVAARLEKDPPSAARAAALLRGHAGPIAGATGARLLRVLWVVAALLGVALVASYFVGRDGGGNGRGVVRSIAVLRLKAGAEESAYLADGLGADLTAALRRLPGIRVAGWNAARAASDAGPDRSRAGAALGVDAVLTGTVTERDGALVVRAELFDVASGARLLDVSHERRPVDVIAVRDTLVRELATKAGFRGRAARVVPAPQRPAADPDVYRLFLKGRFSVAKETPDGVRDGLVDLTQAAERAPGFVAAQLEIVEASLLEPFLGLAAPADALARARAAADRARAAEPLSAEARLALAAVRLHDPREVTAAADDLRVLLETRPHHAAVHHVFGLLQAYQGRLPEAETELAKALELDPDSPACAADLARVRVAAGRADAALQAASRALALAPASPAALLAQGLALEAKADPGGAIVPLEKAVSLTGRAPLAVASLGHVLATGTRKAEARKLLAELKERGKTGFVSPYALAVLQVGLGDSNGALASLEKAREARDPALSWMRVDPRFAGLRKDRRFTDLVKKTSPVVPVS